MTDGWEYCHRQFQQASYNFQVFPGKKLEISEKIHKS